MTKCQSIVGDHTIPFPTFSHFPLCISSHSLPPKLSLRLLKTHFFGLPDTCRTIFFTIPISPLKWGSYCVRPGEDIYVVSRPLNRQLKDIPSTTRKGFS